MAYDLLFGKTRRNWARGPKHHRACLETTIVTMDESSFRLTPSEMTMLADLAATKLLADSGDRRSRKKIAKMVKKMAILRSRARAGDAVARRALEAIEESGVFRGSIQSFSMGGDETLIPNVAYRAAVLRQARKQARKKTGSPSPTTRDFFAAKKAVDKTMGQAGIRLFLPGSRPGRVTY